MSGFQPVGDLARWRVLVEMFCAVERGTLLSYGLLGDALGLDPARAVDRRAIQAAVREASATLSREHERSLVAVRGRGYRVALPDEQLDVAGRQQRKSRNALVRARTHVDHVDLSGMTPETRSMFAAAAQVLAYQEGQIRRLDLRQHDLEAALKSVTTKVERTQEENDRRMAELEARLERLDG